MKSAEHHCGRILGLQLHPYVPGILFAADSSFGLLRVDTHSKQVETLVPRRRVNDKETPYINFPNDVVVLANGSIFFTDSSKKFSRPDVVLEVFEGGANGQLLHFDPVLRMTYVVLNNLHFPNGLCLSNDGTALLFPETTRARILRIYIHWTGRRPSCSSQT
jgi:sugar lactone lactonase YvrE